jgi:aryl-alcohol dehydrogenase-like predicted oxidoreductase
MAGDWSGDDPSHDDGVRQLLLLRATKSDRRHRAAAGKRRYLLVRTVAEAHAPGLAPSQLPLAWLLRRSPVILPIPGTSTVAHLEENTAAASVTLSDDEFEALATVTAVTG